MWNITRGDLHGPRACFAEDMRRLSGRASPSGQLVLVVDAFTEDTTRKPATPALKLPATRLGYGGVAASLALHGLVLGLLVLRGDRLWSHNIRLGDSGLPGSNSGGGGGGNRVAYITLPSIPRPASPPAVRVTTRVRPPKSVQTPVPQPAQEEQVLPEPADTAPAAGGQIGEAVDADTGVGNGAGASSAGGAGGVGIGGASTGRGGEGGTLRPPEPRELPLPYDTPPKELRGASLRVTFWVRVDGRVERYEVEPEIKDRDYARKFDEVMRAFRFTPARAPDGTSVAGVATISFILPGKNSS